MPKEHEGRLVLRGAVVAPAKHFLMTLMMVFPVFILLFCFCALPAWAQGGSVVIEGVVRDSSGALVAKATVTASNPATGQTKIAESTADGSYRLLGIEPARRWILSAVASGFAEQRVTVESLAGGERRVLDLMLAPAKVSDKIVVTSDVPIARTTTPQLGGMLDEEQVNDLPANGRDLISLAYLVPGAAPARGYYNLDH